LAGWWLEACVETFHQRKFELQLSAISEAVEGD